MLKTDREMAENPDGTDLSRASLPASVKYPKYVSVFIIVVHSSIELSHLVGRTSTAPDTPETLEHGLADDNRFAAWTHVFSPIC